MDDLMLTYEFRFERYDPSRDNKTDSYESDVIRFCGNNFDETVTLLAQWLHDCDIHVIGFIEAQMVYDKSDADYYGENYKSQDSTKRIHFRLYDDFDAVYAAKVINRYCRQRTKCDGCPLYQVFDGRMQCICKTPCEWPYTTEEPTYGLDS